MDIPKIKAWLNLKKKKKEAKSTTLFTRIASNVGPIPGNIARLEDLFRPIPILSLLLWLINYKNAKNFYFYAETCQENSENTDKQTIPIPDIQFLSNMI